MCWGEWPKGCLESPQVRILTPGFAKLSRSKYPLAAVPGNELLPTAGSGQEEDDTELERLLYEISDSRHAEDRRDAMSQLANLLRGNQAVSCQQGQLAAAPHS